MMFSFCSEYITLADIKSVMPFGNRADIVVISGKVLKQAFEHSVSDIETLGGRFLQTSGK